MNLKFSFALCSLVAATALAVPGDAAADAERLLGSTRLTKVENDTDVIRFAKCRRGINAVQLRVERGQVEIEKLWVRYAKGGVEYLDVRDRIGKAARRASSLPTSARAAAPCPRNQNGPTTTGCLKNPPARAATAPSRLQPSVLSHACTASHVTSSFARGNRYAASVR